MGKNGKKCEKISIKCKGKKREKMGKNGKKWEKMGKMGKRKRKGGIQGEKGE